MVHIGRLIVALLLTYGTHILYVTNMHTIGYEYSFYWYLGNLNFVIHEAGHMIFLPMQLFTDGRGGTQLLYLLGGSLLQWAVPIAFVIHFGFKRQWISASIFLFWVAQSFYDSVTYIADATALQKDLTLGTIHDWNYILFELGVLHYDLALAQGVKVFSLILASASVLIAWYAFARDLKE